MSFYAIRQDDVTENKRLREYIATYVFGKHYEEYNLRKFIDIDKKYFRNRERVDYYWLINKKVSSAEIISFIYILKEILDNDDTINDEERENVANDIHALSEHIKRVIPQTDCETFDVKGFLDYWRLFKNSERNFMLKGNIESIKYPKNDDEKQRINVRITDVSNSKLFFNIFFAQQIEGIKNLHQYQDIKVNGRLQFEDLPWCDKRVSLAAESFEILSDKPLQLLENEKQLKQLKNEWTSIPCNRIKSSIQNVMIVASPKSMVYEDFMSVIDNSRCSKYYTFELNKLELTEDNITKAIKTLPPKFDCICIIRGGGSLYELLPFSSPKVCEAIYNSKVPVITGIGHAMNQEYLLCNQVVDKACITPSEAARYFIELYEQQTHV